MTPKLLNKIKETTALIGASNPIALLGAVPPDFTFSEYLLDGDWVLYKVDDFKGNWESGVGVFDFTANAITRQTVISSSNADQLVVFLDNGNKIVTSVFDAKIAQQLLDLIPFPYW